MASGHPRLESTIEWFLELVHSPKPPRLVRNVCGLTGALGVASGFMVFFWSLDEAEHPIKFALALLVAALISFIIELLRGLIEHGRKSLRHMPFSRMFITFVILAFVEVFVIAWHSPVIKQGEGMAPAAAAISGLSASHLSPGWWDLFAFAGLWMFVGLVLSRKLATLIVLPRTHLKGAILRGACIGGGAGLFFAPLASLIYILFIRTILAGRLLIWYPDQWKEALDNLRSHLTYFPPLQGGVAAIEMLDELVGKGPWGKGPLRAIILLVVLVAYLWVCVKMKWKWPFIFGFFGVVVIIVAPLCTDLLRLLSIVGLAALIWFIPGVILGALVPLLRQPSEFNAAWPLFAFLGSAILMIVGAVRMAETHQVEPVFTFPAAILALAVIYCVRGRKMKHWWAPVAFSIGTILFAAMIIGQELTFAFMFERVHAINSLPATVNASPGLNVDSWLKDDKSLWNSPKPTLRSEIYVGLDQLLERIQKLVTDIDKEHGDEKEFNAHFDELQRRKDKLGNDLIDFNHRPIQGQLEITFETTDLKTELDDELAKVHDSRIRLQFAGIHLRAHPADSDKEKRKPEIESARQQLEDRLRQRELGLGSIRKDLEELLSKHNFDEEQMKLQGTLARWLELALTGSLGFWVTMGLLAGWKISETPAQTRTEAATLDTRRL